MPAVACLRPSFSLRPVRLLWQMARWDAFRPKMQKEQQERPGKGKREIIWPAGRTSAS